MPDTQKSAKAPVWTVRGGLSKWISHQTGGTQNHGMSDKTGVVIICNLGSRPGHGTLVARAPGKQKRALHDQKTTEKACNTLRRLGAFVVRTSKPFREGCRGVPFPQLNIKPTPTPATDMHDAWQPMETCCSPVFFSAARSGRLMARLFMAEAPP